MDYINLPIPFVAPPPGVTPNFTHPSSRSNIAVAVCTTSLVVTFVLFAVRVYARLRITRSFGYDDYTCVFAMVGSVGYTCAILLSATDGVGPHMWDLLLSSMKPSVFQKVLAGQLLYPPVMFLVKLSLFLLYLRIFAVFRHIRILIFIGIAFHLILYTTSFVLEFVFCYPRRGQSFLVSFTAASCSGDASKLGIAQGVANIIGDFYLLLTPVPVIWKLQLSFQKKIGVTAIFMTGFLGCVTTILGLYYRVLAMRSTDSTWILIPNYITSAVEINVGIICSCMPSLPSFFRQLHSKPLQFPCLTRILSRLNRRTRQSDSTPRGAVSIRSERNASRAPALKEPIREDIRFGKMFRMAIGNLQSGWSALDTQATGIRSTNSPTSSQLEKGAADELEIRPRV